MDEHRAGYSLKAPGRSGSGSLRLPGRSSFPRVDDHLVEAEVTRDEVIGGRRVVALPAHLPHASQQTRLDFVIEAHVAPGYQAATDLLTRHDEDSDFASDTCISRKGTDPATGARYLEEIVFEIVSEQNESEVTEKAMRMHRRGVRRIFAVFVKGPKGQRVCEWSAERQNWCPLDLGSRIEDPCLVTPLEVAAMLDVAAAHHAVVEALAAQGDPTLRQREAAAEARGEARGRAEAVLDILDARGIAVSEEQRAEISGCEDPARLSRWLRRAALASTAGEVLKES